MVTWIIPVRSRIKKKARPPRSLTSWTQPQISACSLAGVTDCMGMRMMSYIYGVQGIMDFMGIPESVFLLFFLVSGSCNNVKPELN